MPQDHPTEAEELRRQARTFKRRAQEVNAQADALWKQAQECEEKAEMLDPKKLEAKK